MPYEIPPACPICKSALTVTRLQCPHCHTAMEGSFEPGRLGRLNPAQQQFVISFLKCRGNIKDMEKEYSISYPTVRARLDEIVTSLGEEPVQGNREVLEKLARGEIDAQKAFLLLKNEE